MQNVYLKIAISFVGIAIIVARLINPNIKLDSPTLILVGISILPWMSSLIKSVELPGGFKIEFQELSQERKSAVKKSRPITAANPTPVDTTRNLSSEPKASRYPERYQPPVDSYFDRFIKLTPVESIMSFVVINNMLANSTVSSSSLIQWAIFILLVVFTAYWSWKNVEGFVPQVMVMTLGFIVWAFAIGGPFTLLDWYNPLYGSLLLLVYGTSIPLLIFNEPSD